MVIRNKYLSWFVNFQQSDFRHRKDAEVFKKIPTFHKIPFKQIGLRDIEIINNRKNKL